MRQPTSSLRGKGESFPFAFWGATTLAFALYALTAPVGLPWNPSSHLALAYLGETVRLPSMPWPVWGFYVQVFGGSVALAVTMASVAAGFLASLVNRCAGWRFAAATALLWIFLPPVWNGAIAGERTSVLVSMAVVALWALHAVGLWVTRKARTWRAAWRKTSGGLIEATLPAETVGEKRRRMKRLVGWIVLGAAGVFAGASLRLHDSNFGEAASTFARGVVDAARDRIIVMNGLCDDQIVREESIRSMDAEGRVLSLRSDDAYRAALLSRVRRAFPGETNLWIAAEVSPAAFAAAAAKVHPDRFHFMNGKSTTLAQWENRWREFKPYLDSTDPFVPTARRLFAYEGNAVANALAATAAWRLYKLVYEEVDPGNVSALVNMNEMIRNGYPAGGSEKLLVEKRLAQVFENRQSRQRARELVRAAGPVRASPARLAKLADEARTRIAARVAAGEPIAPSPEAMTLAEWNNEMIVLMNRGETDQAGRLARLILSNPKWRGHIPANAVMGGVTAKAGDYAASDSFYRTATATTNRIPARVLNGYADTLLNLGRLDESERMARRAVRETDENFWMARLTLAEVLFEKWKAKGGEGEGASSDGAEIRALLKTVPSNAPKALRERARMMAREVGR